MKEILSRGFNNVDPILPNFDPFFIYVLKVSKSQKQILKFLFERTKIFLYFSPRSLTWVKSKYQNITNLQLLNICVIFVPGHCYCLLQKIHLDVPQDSFHVPIGRSMMLCFSKEVFNRAYLLTLNHSPSISMYSPLRSNLSARPGLIHEIFTNKF